MYVKVIALLTFVNSGEVRQRETVTWFRSESRTILSQFVHRAMNVMFDRETLQNPRTESNECCHAAFALLQFVCSG
jgi:hypothetical protein